MIASASVGLIATFCSVASADDALKTALDLPGYGNDKGKWVKTTSVQTPGATQPANISRVWRNGFFIVIQEEKTWGTATAAAKPISLQINGHSWSGNVYSNSVADSGAATYTENYQWTWVPAYSGEPVADKSVTMQITGSATATASVAMGGDDSVDGASASATFGASGSGTVGGNEIVAMTTDPSKKIEVSAYVVSSNQETKTDVSGELKKTKGGGSVGGDASYVASTTFNGVSTKSGSITITAAISATAGTGGVGSYGISLSQGITGSLSCANSAFDDTSASLTATSNFSVSP